jgi:hypothetical protein
MYSIMYKAVHDCSEYNLFYSMARNCFTRYTPTCHVYKRKYTVLLTNTGYMYTPMRTLGNTIIYGAYYAIIYTVLARRSKPRIQPYVIQSVTCVI